MRAPSTNDFLSLLGTLNASGVHFALVGGAAAVLHGASTATYDLDIVMPFADQNCSRLLDALKDVHPRLAHTPDKRPLRLTAQQLTAFKDLYLTTDLGRLDVLGNLPPVGSAEEIIASAETMDIGGTVVRVISLAQLIQVKAAMNRPKDRQVEAELRAIADILKARTRT